MASLLVHAFALSLARVIYIKRQATKPACASDRLAFESFLSGKKSNQ
jgi:hypothetical protein